MYMNTHVCTHVYNIHMFLSSERAWAPWEPSAISTPSIRYWFLNIFLHYKELGLLGKMVDSRTGTGKTENSPGTSFVCLKVKEENTQRMIGTCQQNTEVSLKKNPTGQIKDTLSIKIMIVKNYNPLSKTGNHELALIHINWRFAQKWDFA